MENFAHFVEMMIVRHNNNNLIIAARDKAIAAEKSKTEFFANVSHDIRTPVNAISGFSKIITRQDCTEEELKGYLQNIIISSNNLVELMDELIDISQIDSDHLKFDIAKHDFTKLCNETMGTFTALIDHNNVSLRVDVPQMPELEFDIKILRRIISNYINNAIKYTPKGTITLHAEFKKDDKSTGTLKFEVIDTGIGIKEGDIAKLAQPFVQIDATQSGHGLGLSICKKFLHQMGGRQTISSVFGRGSSFGGIIPGIKYHDDTLSPADAPMNPPKSESGKVPPEAENLNVLVVDDELFNRMVLKKMLKGIGLKNIFEAKDGEAAFEILQTTHIDVVLTDARMPKVNGKELARKIRADAQLKALPVYVITGENNYIYEEGNQVFNKVLFKPVDIDVLIPLFDEICAKRSVSQRL